MSTFEDRILLFKEIEKNRKSKVLLYVTGDRRGLETQISQEIIDLFVEHLDLIGPTKKISLILHTNGGQTSAAWRLINLLRTFCDELEVLVPLKALSAGTLISLGADRIVMTKQAALGPIDPSSNGPLNPQIPGAPPGITAPVSVEAVRGYLEAAKQDSGITTPSDLVKVFVHLSERVHPLVLGQIFRTRQQIRDLARKLLVNQVSDPKKTAQIIDFLCSESGSHDYTINRREGSALGLNIEKPSASLYKTLKSINDSYRDELQLLQPYDSLEMLGRRNSRKYDLPRCLIESVGGGSHRFITKGTVSRISAIGPDGIETESINDTRTFEGWSKVK